MYISVTSVECNQSQTKKEIASSAAKVYIILGWFSPAVVRMKILLQRAWEAVGDWDQPVPEVLANSWKQWCQDLHQLQTKGMPRPLIVTDKTVLEIQLHGFSDASSVAYGGVVYVRTLYADTSVTVSLLMSKTRVTPLKTSTIPRLELCAAVLTTKLLKASAEDLGIDTSRVFVWTDFLSWLNSSNSRLKVYVAYRVKEITDILPTDFNPAHLASRGVLLTELLAKHL